MTAIIVLTGLAVIIYFSSMERSIEFLTVNQPVEADLLIVEGWVEESVLTRAVEEFESDEYSYLITTGSKIDPYYMLSTVGLLEYNFTEQPIYLKTGDTLDVCVKGSAVNDIYAEFSVFFNDRKISQQYSTMDWDYYSFVIDSTFKLRRVGITFDNDEVYFEQDRNLYVRSVQIKGNSYPARSRYSFYYQKKDFLKQNPKPTDFHSLAAICAEKLQRMGVPEEKIIVLEAPKSEKNRTFISALVVNQWIESNEMQDVSLNIISECIHSRRTHMLYRYALKKSCKAIGIISVIPDDNRYLGNHLDKKDIIRELIGNFYYRFLFDSRTIKEEFKSSE